jgi:tRNA threonylcarbamoyladenosine biosynthesis protein TsaE
MQEALPLKNSAYVDTITSCDKETINTAKALAARLLAGDIVCLQGPLGAGKTTFVKGLISELCSISHHEISSPTFTYMHIYPSSPSVHHFDMYRLDGDQQLFQMGLNEYIEDTVISIVEWPEKTPSILHRAHYIVQIAYIDSNKRRILITKRST